MRVQPVFALVGMPVLLLLAFGTALAPAAVKVRKDDPVVQHKTFDPADPPADLPPLEPGLDAACAYRFNCNVSMRYKTLSQRRRGGRCRVAIRIYEVRPTLSLAVTVWLPEGAREKLKAHEEGHRRISQRVYETAEADATAVAKKWDGRRLEGEGETCEQAARDLLRAAAKEAHAETVARLVEKARGVNRIYDDLTDHGRRDEPGEDEAIRLAFERYEKEAEAGKGKAERQ